MTRNNMHVNQVPKSRFKAKALEFLRQIELTGQPMVITDNGRPTVEVRRFRSDHRSPLERLRGSVAEYQSPVEPVGETDWEALD